MANPTGFPQYTALPQGFRESLLEFFDPRDLNSQSQISRGERAFALSFCHRGCARIPELRYTYRSLGAYAPPEDPVPAPSSAAAPPPPAHAGVKRCASAAFAHYNDGGPVKRRGVSADGEPVPVEAFSSLPPVPEFSHEQELEASALRLAKEIKGLVQGISIFNQITEGEVGTFRHPVVQVKMSQALWNFRAIGLVPLVKSVDGGGEFFSQIDTHLLTEFEKFELLKNWLAGKTEDVTEINIDAYQNGELLGKIAPLYCLSQKVYRVLPDEISLFKNLTTLKLPGNLLNRLPLSLSSLPIETLDLSRNKFSAIPGIAWVIPSLKTLHLEGNPIDFHTLLDFLRARALSGHEITVYFDSDFDFGSKFEVFQKEIASQGEKFVVKKGANFLSLMSTDLAPTQPIEDDE